MIKTYEITVDIENDLYTPSNLLFSVSNNDFETVELMINIKQDNANMNLEGTTVELAIKKPSGLTVYQETEIVDPVAGSVRIMLKNQAYLEDGVHTGELYVRNINQVAVSCPFYYFSRESIMNDSEMESSNEWSALQQALFAYDLKPVLVEGFPTVVPEYAGQMAFDTINKKTYIATDLTAVSWQLIGSGEGGAGGNDDVLGTGAPTQIPARIGQIYIDINGEAYIAMGSTAASWEQINNAAETGGSVWGNITGNLADQDDLTAALAGKADTAHTHTIANVTGLQAELDSKLEAVPAEYLTQTEADGLYLKTIPATYLTETEAAAIYQPKGTYLTGVPAEYLTETEGDLRYLAAETDITPTWGEIIGSIANQADLTNALAAKADDSDLAGKANITHTHAITDVTGLQPALDSKAAGTHTHGILDISGLQTALDSKMDDSEKAALLTEAEGDVRYKAAGAPVEAHTHAITDVTGLQGALDSKADDVDLWGLPTFDDVYVKAEVYNKTEIDQMTMGEGGGSPVLVEDNLASTSATNALSANQGRILNTTKASLNHTHTVSQVTDFAAGVAANIPAEYLTDTEAGAAYAAKTHNHTVANITDFAAGVAANIPAEYITATEADGTYLKTVPAEYLTDVEGNAAYQPKGNYAPDVHTHTAANITDFAAAVAANIPAEYLTDTEGNATYAKTVNVYSKAAVDSLVNAKADTAHTHTVSQVTDFAAGVAANIPAEYLTTTEANAAYQPAGSYAPATHTHTAANISDFGTAVAANIPAAYVTDTEANAAYQPKGTYLTTVPLMTGAAVGGAMVGNGLAMAGNYLLVKRGAGIGLAGDNSITVDSLNGLKLWSGTQANYDLITTPDPATLYFITG